MNSPKVSVVIPVFRGMPYLSALIHSLKRQTYENIEILAAVTPADDGGEAELESAGIKVVETPTGTTAARNWTIATELASGEFTKLICQDDVLYPTAIEHQVSDLLNNPTAVMAIAKRDIVDSKGNRLFTGRGLTGLQGRIAPGSQVLKRSYLHGGNVFGEPLAVLFRTEFLKEAMPWRDDNPLMLDLNTYTLVAPKGDIALRHESIGAFRVSSTSWSTTISKSQLQQTKEWQKEYEATHETSGRERLEASIGRHIQTSTRRAAYAYLNARRSL